MRFEEGKLKTSFSGIHEQKKLIAFALSICTDETISSIDKKVTWIIWDHEWPYEKNDKKLQIFQLSRRDQTIDLDGNVMKIRIDLSLESKYTVLASSFSFKSLLQFKD